MVVTLNPNPKPETLSPKPKPEAIKIAGALSLKALLQELKSVKKSLPLRVPLKGVEAPI